MQNYVLIYKLSNEQSENDLIEQIKKTFPRNRSAIENDVNYFVFASRELSFVKDALQEIMDLLSLVDPDYIALYYTREEEPDEVKRLMVFGTAKLVENDKDLKKLSQTTQEIILRNLLELDFIKSS